MFQLRSGFPAFLVLWFQLFHPPSFSLFAFSYVRSLTNSSMTQVARYSAVVC